MKKVFALMSFLVMLLGVSAQSFESPQQFISVTSPWGHTANSVRAIGMVDTTGIGVDTSFNFFPVFNLLPGHPCLYTFGLGTSRTGYLYGNNGSLNNFTEVAQGYKNANHYDICISGVLCWFGAKQSDLGSSPTSKVVLKVYDMDTTVAYNVVAGAFNATLKNWPGPSILKDSTDLLFSNISDSINYSYASFATPPWIWSVSDFAIGCDFTHLAAGDTVGLMSDKKNDAFNLDFAFHKAGNGKWLVSDETFSGATANGELDNDIALWAVLSPGTGVQEYYNGMKLSTYPNPSLDQVTIEYSLEKNSKNVSLWVIDPTGKKLMEQNYGEQSSGVYSVNIQTNQLSAGNYFYQLRANGQIFTKQFIVSK